MTNVPSPGRRVLVTGASGLIGEAVMKRLLADGYDAKGLVRTKNPAFPCVIGDMTDAVSLRRATENIDWVVHLAARKSDEADSDAVNVQGARNLADACKTNGVKLIINVSTQSVKLKAKGTYARTKAEADAILRGCSVPVITLMPSVVYGDRTQGIFGSLLAFLKLPIVPVIGKGNGRFRPIHKDDVATVIEKIAQVPQAQGQSFDVGGPDELSMNALLATLMQRTGKKKITVHIPIPAALLIANILKLLGKPIITVSNVLGAAEDIPMNIEPLRKAIGWTPQSLQTGLDAIFATTEITEASALLAYVLGTGNNCDLTAEKALYERAVAANNIPPHALDRCLLGQPRKLGAIDAASRLLRPQCLLQQKLLIAAAVVECSPVSADIYLPKNRSVFSLVTGVGTASVSAVIKLIIGTATMICRPSFFRRNAGV